MTSITYNPTGPSGANYPDGTLLANDLAGKHGERLGADLHGPYFNANVRRNLFTFLVEGVALPFMSQGASGTTGTNGLVAVCSLYNPPNSGVIAEIISTSIGHTTATTVVTSLGWYGVPSAVAAAGVFTTKGTNPVNYFSGRVGETPGGVIIPYTSYAYSSNTANVLVWKQDHVATFGAVTDPTLNSTEKLHNGRLILTPGNLISLGAGTAVTASANAQVTWAEWPFA